MTDDSATVFFYYPAVSEKMLCIAILQQTVKSLPGIWEKGE